MEALNKKISDMVSEALDRIFEQAHKEAGTQSGDISTEQVIKLHSIHKELTKLVTDNIKENIRPTANIK
jgi:hypothetical protein